MKKYRIKIHIEEVVYANDEEEALEIFWQKVESTPQQDLASFIDEYTTIKEIKKGESKNKRCDICRNKTNKVKTLVVCIDCLKEILTSQELLELGLL